MKILIIGGNGTIGKVVSNDLSSNHEVIIAGRTSGDVNIDIADSISIKEGLEKVGQMDAIINISGEAKWADFNDLSEEDYYVGLRSKLMGQVNIVRIGQHHVSPNGSITLSTGILADDPVLKTTSAAMVNGGIHSFVQAVALEIGHGIRVNAVSLGLVQDSYDKYKDFFPGHNPISMDQVVFAYRRSVLGNRSGDVIKVYG